MWHKNRKVLSQAAPYLDEGMILIYPSYKVEILTSAACRFLKVEAEKKSLHFFDIEQSPLTSKIEEMIEGGIEKATVEYNEKTLLLRLRDIDNGESNLIIIKDDSSQEKMLHMGKEFVGNASHELRTPITIIKGFTEMLLESDAIEPSMQKSILKKNVSKL